MEQLSILTITKDELVRLIANEVENHIKVIQRPENEYYTRKQVCELLHISLATCHSMMNIGAIEPLKSGRRTLFLKSKIDSDLLSGKLAKYKRYN